MRSQTILITLVVLTTSTIAQAQAEPPPGWGTSSWYKSQTENVVNNARRMIEPVLSTADREIARSIRYRVSATQGVGAFATWEDGRRVAMISTGFVQISEWLAEAYIYDTELDASGCFNAYSQYLGEKIIINTERNRKGLPPRVVQNPLLYAHESGGPCSSVDPAEFRSRPDLGQYRAKLIEASIVLLYLHELAHHVLGHTDRLRKGDYPDLAMQRSEEDAADRWAITTALKANYNLVAAVPAYTFIALTGGNSIEAELQMTHPLGIRRVLTLYEEVISHYKENPDEWRGPPTVEILLTDLESDLDAISEKLDSLD